MSFGSIEQLEWVVAKLAYLNFQSHTPEEYVPLEQTHEETMDAWMAHARELISVIGPAVELATIRETPKPIPAVHEMGRAEHLQALTADVQNAARNVAYQRGVATTMGKFATALKTRIWASTSNPFAEDDELKREVFQEVETWIDDIASQIMDQRLTLADEETPNV